MAISDIKEYAHLSPEDVEELGRELDAIRADIEESRPATTSVMPEGLLDPLPDDQVRDLFRYLQSSGPPAP